jgi:hypothetical protein
MDSDAEGCASDAFNYFKARVARFIAGMNAHLSVFSAQVLCIQGFLAARKHAEQILLLAEMMQVRLRKRCTSRSLAQASRLQSWNVPCFRGGAKVIQQLRKRFHLGSTEEQCVELVLTLIGDRCSQRFAFLLSPLSADSARGAAWTRGAHASTTTISALSTASASLFLLVAWSSSDALVRAGIL